MDGGDATKYNKILFPLYLGHRGGRVNISNWWPTLLEFTYTCTYCAHWPSLVGLVLAVCVITIITGSPLTNTTFTLSPVITRTASLQKSFVY